MLVGEFETILTSPDGQDWTERNRQAPGERLYSVRYLDGTFFAVGSAGTIARSNDGTSWSFTTVPASTALRDIASTQRASTPRCPSR